MGFAKPIEQYLFGNQIHVFMYLKDIIRGEITMKALRFYDVQDLRYEDAPDPVIEKPDDVIVKVKAVGI